MTSPYELTLTLKTLTPIWTGGAVQGTMRTKESGIVGSMRFWASRLFDENTVNTLFGSTEQARSFRLHVDGLNSVSAADTMPEFKKYMSPAVFRRMVEGKFALWGGSKSGEFSVNFQFRWIEGGHSQHVARLQETLQFMERYTGIGARTQYGFGQFVIVHGADRRPTIRVPECFAGATFRSKAKGVCTIAIPALKKHIFLKLTYDQRTRLFGGVIPRNNRKGTRFGSRLHISYPYLHNGHSVVKVWCFRETKADLPTADNVLNAVRNELQNRWG